MRVHLGSYPLEERKKGIPKATNALFEAGATC